jgi:ABC-type transport system involved in multi-copper enzyme maturation permease subunit
MNIARTIVLSKNVFQELVRDRILYIIGFYILVLAIGKRVITEFTSISADKIFLDFGISVIGAIGLIVVVFLGTGLVNKEIDKRTILVLIAKPISRSEFITSKYLGSCAVLALIIAIMTGIYMGFLQFGKISYSSTSLAIAILFLFFQLSLVNAVAITMGAFTNSLMAATLTFAIYLMGNISHEILKLGRLSHNLGMEHITQGLYLLLPDLSRLDLKNDAVYGLQAIPDLLTLITNASYGLLYSIMLLSIAIVIFLQREF